MTISSQDRQAGPYSGNGVTVAFPFSFKVFSANDLDVIQANSDGVETTLTITTDYSVSLNANQDSNPGGTVTMLTAPVTGDKLTITSNIEALQLTDLTNNGGFYPKVITNAFDKLTILIQQALNGLARAPKFPISDGVSEQLFPSVSERAGKYLAFDPTGAMVASIGSVIFDEADSSQVGFIQAGSGAVATTVQSALRLSVSAKNFGAVGDWNGTTGTDDTAAIQAALTYAATAGAPKKVVVPYGAGGRYKITSQLTIAAGITLELESTAVSLEKNFNGHLLRLNGGLITLTNLCIVGNGATYSGGGVYIPAGTPNNICINNARITDTADSCIVFDGTAGVFFNCSDSYLTTTNVATPAVRVDPTAVGWDVGTNPVVRSFINCSSSTRILIDLTGMVTTFLYGGQCAGITFNNGSSPPAYISAKAVIVGVRSTVGFDVDGQDHKITSVNLGSVAPSGVYSIQFAATSSGCTATACATPFGVLDLATGLGANANRFETFNQSYSGAWQSTGTQPVLGNGTLTAYHSVIGRKVSVTLYLTLGSTSTMGTGSWKFTLPYQATATSLGGGTVRGLRTAVAFRTGVAVLLSSGSPSTLEVYSDNTGASWGATTPVTWATGDYVSINFEYVRG